jgi:hypothetical protein
MARHTCSGLDSTYLKGTDIDPTVEGWRETNPVAKYDPLFEHLYRADKGPIELSFAEIDRLVGGLPASARRYTAWWSNEPARSSHVQAAAWREAGRQVVQVDLNAQRVRFSAARWVRGS